MNRLLIFVHYNPHGELASHILYTLEKMRPFYNRVVFVSNSDLDSESRYSVQKYCEKIKTRKNKGFDFGAWKEALFDEGWDALISYDYLTLMNDSCFGPIYDMKNVYDAMEIPEVDFWGLTNHRSTNSGMPTTNKSIPEHIQSYFMSFNKDVIGSQVFFNFWEEITFLPTVNEVIHLYETQLTKLLAGSDFKFKVFLDTSLLSCKESDIATWRPDFLVARGNPFVKIKGFLHFPHPVYLKKRIQILSKYPIGFIDDYFNKTYHPNISLKIENKNILVSKHNEKPLSRKLSIAIHCHVYYTDVFKNLYYHIQAACENFDLFITTDSLDKKKTIASIIQKYKRGPKLKDILIYENRGRDVFPWLNISEKLSQYDLAGHFHTKKKMGFDEWVGDSWLEEIIDSLIQPVGDIIEQFDKHRDIGIILPDIPLFFNLLPEIDTLKANKTIVDNLWLKMNCKKSINVNEIATPIMAYGNMFWYRPQALKPLFDLRLSINDFPAEPLSVDGSIAHAIERLPVYVAWNQGYDFRIAISKSNILSGVRIREDIFKKIDQFKTVYQSRTWRIGRMMTWLPRILKSRFLSK